MAKQKQDGFPALFAGLKRNLDPDAGRLAVTNDGEGRYSLDAPPSTAYPDGLSFGGVVVNKNCVSYHLMSVLQRHDAR